MSLLDLQHRMEMRSISDETHSLLSTVEDFDGTTAVFEVEVERMGMYTAFLACAKGRGLDPDATVFGPDGAEVASTERSSNMDSGNFHLSELSTYRIDVDVYNCQAEACAYMVMLVPRQ